MIKKKSLVFFLFVFYSTTLWAGVTGWYCGTCSISNLAMSEGTTYCESNPCDPDCYFCGTVTTNEFVTITGGTRTWQSVCTETAIYCYNGLESVCEGV